MISAAVPGTAVSLGCSCGCVNPPSPLPASFPPHRVPPAPPGPQERGTTSLVQDGTLLGASSQLCAAPRGGHVSVPLSRGRSRRCGHTGPKHAASPPQDVLAWKIHPPWSPAPQRWQCRVPAPPKSPSTSPLRRLGAAGWVPRLRGRQIHPRGGQRAHSARHGGGEAPPRLRIQTRICRQHISSIFPRAGCGELRRSGWAGGCTWGPGGGYSSRGRASRARSLARGKGRGVSRTGRPVPVPADLPVPTHLAQTPPAAAPVWVSGGAALPGSSSSAPGCGAAPGASHP